MSFINDITSYKPKNEQEMQDKKIILKYMDLFPENVLSRENEIAHITSSGFIINQNLDKSLMIHHNIRNTWAWTGGHADGDGNLLEVAIREAFEETGITVKALSSQIASIDILTVTGHIKRDTYVNSHLHLSIAYILIADERDAPIVKPDENSAVKWLPIEKINEDCFTSLDVYLYTKLLKQAISWTCTDIAKNP